MTTLLRATGFEFRQRFFLIGVIFFLGFSASAVDPVNAASGLVRFLAQAGFAVEAARRIFAVRLVFALGALLTFAAAAVRIWAAAYLDSSVVHDARLHAETVVADGPYRYLTVGMATLASRLGWVVIVVGIVVFVLRLIGREEAELAAAQGERYAAYRAAVPRLLPALRPRVPASGAAPRWGQAFWGESFVVSFALALAAFVPTFDLRFFYFLVGAGFAARLLFKARHKPRAS
jgi:protein-S-isoprenylcysteine O-methyltransferase Ste14